MDEPVATVVNRPRPCFRRSAARLARPRRMARVRGSFPGLTARLGHARVTPTGTAVVDAGRVGDRQATVGVACRYDTPHPGLAGARRSLSRCAGQGLGSDGGRTAAAHVAVCRGSLLAFPALAGRTGQARLTPTRNEGGRSGTGGRWAGHRPSCVTSCRGDARVARISAVGARRASPARAERRGNGNLLVLSVQVGEARVSLPRIGGGRVVLVDGISLPSNIGRYASGSTRCCSLGSVCFRLDPASRHTGL